MTNMDISARKEGEIQQRNKTFKSCSVEDKITNVIVIVGLCLVIFISPTQAQMDERIYGEKDLIFEDGTLPMSKTEGEGWPWWVSTGVRKYLKVSKRKDFETISSLCVGTCCLFDRGVAGREIIASVNGQNLTIRSKDRKCTTEIDIMTSWHIQMVTHFSNDTVPASCRLLLSKNLQDPFGEKTPQRGEWGSKMTSWGCVADFTFYPLHPKNLDHKSQKHEVPFMGLISNRTKESVSPVWVSVIEALTIKIQYHHWILTSGDPEICEKDHVFYKEKSPIRIEDVGDVISLDTQYGLFTWNLNVSLWDLAAQVPACGPFLDRFKQELQRWLMSSILQKIILRKEREGEEVGSDELNRWREEWFNNTIDLWTIANKLFDLAALGVDSKHVKLVKNAIKRDLIMYNYSHLTNVTEDFQAQIQHLQREARDIKNVNRYSLSCVALQEKLYTNAKVFLQTLLNGHWPKEMGYNWPRISDFAKKHKDWWKITWMGCSSQEADDCKFAVLMPIKGNVYSILNRVDMGMVHENLWITTQSNDNVRYIYTSKGITKVATSMCGRVQSSLICPNGFTNFLPDKPFRTNEGNLCPMISEETKSPLFWQFRSGELCFHCPTNQYVTYHTGKCTVTKLVSPGLYCTDHEVLDIRVDSPDRLYQPDLLLIKRFSVTYQQPILPNPSLEVEEEFYEMSKDLEILKKFQRLYSQQGQCLMDPTDRKEKNEKNINNNLSVSWLDEIVLLLTEKFFTFCHVIGAIEKIEFLFYAIQIFYIHNCISSDSKIIFFLDPTMMNDIRVHRHYMNNDRTRG